MGCTSSRHAMDDAAAAAKSRAIDAEIARERKEREKQIKVLLLGTGESGKSTVMKQMTILYGNGFSQPERDEYRLIVQMNTIQSMQAILSQMPFLDLEIQESSFESANVVRSYLADPPGFEHVMCKAIQVLWYDRAVREAFRRRKEYQLNDSADYFFDHADRTFSTDYVPSDQDIVHARVKSTGITERKFQIENRILAFYDVGGQRSERRKWASLFENVNVLLFMVAISEYDQTLREDSRENRLHESMTVFESIVNSKWFIQSTLVLFLNKIDLFRKQLATSPLVNVFPDYAGGPDDYGEACSFMLHKFIALSRRSTPFYHHFTCATDRESFKLVIEAVNDNILRQSLERTGFL